MKKESGLKRRYRVKEFIWNLFLKDLLLLLFSTGWKNAPIVWFPLTVDMELGTIRYYYYRYGLFTVMTRLYNYNKVLLLRMEQTEDEENFDDLFTEDEQYLREIEDEMREIEEDDD